MNIFRILIPFLLLAGLITCSQGKETVNELPSTTIAQEYSGNLMNVDKIELVDSSTGSRKWIEDKFEVQAFISDVKDVSLISDKNQEGRTGYIYRIILYEKEKVMLDFIPTQLDTTYYEPNDDLIKVIKKKFEEKFGKKF